ncbi:M20/M25/M40 family metallo-hydrolase [Microbacterium azadirachtae]|uniref:Putative succinyl-diaminopimelate desuccinylase n=1 Tax=Microbacterium azadirachtae TaxID=582680 RepID=A0A0F0KDM4_9MICO|nr:M20/M25/M40 family metallo-hydrolase [Microbacterium azadirachtae]KJL18963.1 putative succinyl-diaminopimelate desuccinylase [Microbacterium azadirachtae]UXW87502.1 M20/M25/M40 family metallo-hydrolase [Microbacterium azadirachtae]SDL24249.1 Acetylornithine deacetylase/Succinyl-diaminopimelate desuccinylase [Microbacterium azadirachtae]SEF54132.1 Acetylornithine deacetylase/Succinyl-diaminopimelate desuccinylase [Microbacterium azadirachtae]SEF54393.1 Acetylornithine deacetylase/Succinyl-di
MPQPDAELPEVARIAADLIRFDTSNFGGGDAKGEREAAEYVGAYLESLGLEPEYYEPIPRRTNVMARVPGRDRDKPALVVHGHLDVVPAMAGDWSVDPFAGVVQDGMLWGRGAVDMKNMDAMILTSVAEILRAGEQPERDLILVFFADEENGGVEGSALVVQNRPEWFAGATEAISEVGGYSIPVGDQRAYLLQVGEKALLWIRLIATGRAGHGSRFHPDNAVTKLAEAVAAIGRTQWPIRLTDTTREFLQRMSALTGLPVEDPDALAAAAGPAEAFLRSTLRTTTNPTVLQAGYKHNVIPERAEALIDVRVIPGMEDEVLAQLRELVGDDVELEMVVQDIGMETPFAGDLVDAMVAALGRHDPGVPVIPYLLGAGTDNKALAFLGITGYGFAPLRLPADLDFTGMFHGVDERVPIDSLVFGQRVLTDLLRTY